MKPLAVLDGVASPAAPLPGASRPLFRGTLFIGYAILLVFFVGFGGWAVFARLDSAAVAPGSVVVDTKRKVIQHLEGGIVQDILVRDGDRVAAGQLLVRLDPTQARAALDMAENRYEAALATAARLEAEELDRPAVEFPAELLSARASPETKRLLDGQTRIFEARRDEIATQIGLLRQRDQEVQEEIRGLEGQIASERTQIALIAEEATTVGELLRRGLEHKPRLLALQRQKADIEGDMSKNVAAIARARQTISETGLRITALRSSRFDDAVKEHGEILKELFEASDRRAAARDVLRRTEIRAPLDGVVVNEAVHTRGGVLAPGATAMEIVPTADRLVIEAKVGVADIGRIHAGLPAQIRLISYDRRNAPTFDGSVIWVSADRIDDEKSHASYYSARVVANEAELAKRKDARLYPGMNVEVLIVTEKRTLLDYLLAPFNRTLARGMHEF